MHGGEDKRRGSDGTARPGPWPWPQALAEREGCFHFGPKHDFIRRETMDYAGLVPVRLGYEREFYTNVNMPSPVQCALLNIFSGAILLVFRILESSTVLTIINGCEYISFAIHGHQKHLCSSDTSLSLL